MKERLENDLCYNCDKKWGLGHKCKVTQLFIIECEVSTNEDEPIPARGIKAKAKVSSKNEPIIVEA